MQSKSGALKSRFGTLVAMGLTFLAVGHGDQKGLWAQDAAPAAEEKKQDPAENAGTSQDGEADLNLAFEKKITANTEADLRAVIDLCDSAISKGLNEEQAKQAKELKVSALQAGAEQLSLRILGPETDPRWRVFRGRALKMLEEATDTAPESYDSWILIAKLQVLPGGSAEKARAAADKAVELAKDSPKKLATALLIRSASAGDDRDGRLADLNRAVEADPENLDARKARGALLLEMEKPDEATADFEAWLAAEPGNVGAWLIVAASLEEKGKTEEAVKLLDQAIEKNPEAAMLYATRGRIRAAREENEAALADLARATELDESNTEAWFTRSTLYLQDEKYDEALAAINKVLDVNEFDVRGKWVRSLILASQENYKASLKDLRWLTANIPDNEMFQLQLAAVLSADKQLDKAIEIYDEIVENGEDKGQALRSRGDAYLGAGKHKEALADYEAALELIPEDSGLLNNLAWLLATSTFDELRDGKRSLEYALKACELTEYKAAHILSTLASGYAETGDFVRAREWAEKAVALAETEKQKAGLQEELDQYKLDKPWRENEGEKAAAEEAGGSSDKKDEAKPDADKTDADKPESKEGEEGKGGGDDKKAGEAEAGKDGDQPADPAPSGSAEPGKDG